MDCVTRPSTARSRYAARRSCDCGPPRSSAAARSEMSCIAPTSGPGACCTGPTDRARPSRPGCRRFRWFRVRKLCGPQVLSDPPLGPARGPARGARRAVRITTADLHETIGSSTGGSRIMAGDPDERPRRYRVLSSRPRSWHRWQRAVRGGLLARGDRPDASTRPLSRAARACPEPARRARLRRPRTRRRRESSGMSLRDLPPPGRRADGGGRRDLPVPGRPPRPRARPGLIFRPRPGRAAGPSPAASRTRGG